MNFPSKLLEDAVNSFASLPGVGKKTALRLVLFLLQKDKNFTENFASSIRKMRAEIKECSVCFNLSDAETCSVCRDKSRNDKVICIVENIRDVMAIEETGQFKGMYHVLGGVISPIDGVGPSELNIEPLIERIKKTQTEEIIMAVSPTIEGETTIFYISKQLKGLDLKISTIARGVAFGGELQYTDEITLGRSIVSRIPYKVEE